MTPPPKGIFAQAARHAIESHAEWDSLHAFVTFFLEDGDLAAGTWAAIDPGIDPPDYPRLMMKLARKDLDEYPDRIPYAYLLQIEAFGVIEPGKDASAEEKMRFQADRLGRTFHQRPDASEIACAYVADVHGRLWSAVKRRGREEEISENFYPPGPHQPGGQLIRGLLSVAYATGMLCHGLPGPASLTN